MRRIPSAIPVLLLLLALASGQASAWEPQDDPELTEGAALVTDGLLHVVAPAGQRAAAARVLGPFTAHHSDGILVEIPPRPGGPPGGVMLVIGPGEVRAQPLGLHFVPDPDGETQVVLAFHEVESHLSLTLLGAEGADLLCEVDVVIATGTYRFAATGPQREADGEIFLDAPAISPRACGFTFDDGHAQSAVAVVRRALLTALEQTRREWLAPLATTELAPRFGFAGRLPVRWRGRTGQSPQFAIESESRLQLNWVEVDRDETPDPPLWFDSYDITATSTEPVCGEWAPLFPSPPIYTPAHTVVAALPHSTAPGPDWEESLVFSHEALALALSNAVEAGLPLRRAPLLSSADGSRPPLSLDAWWPGWTPRVLQRDLQAGVTVRVRVAKRTGAPAISLGAGDGESPPRESSWGANPLHLEVDALHLDIHGTVGGVDVALLRLALSQVALALAPRSHDTGDIGVTLLSLTAATVVSEGGLLDGGPVDLTFAGEILSRAVATWVLLPATLLADPRHVVVGALWTTPDRYAVLLGVPQAP